MRPSQKVVLIIGCFWMLFMSFGFIVGYLRQEETKSIFTALNTTFTPVLLLWWPTGVLKIVSDWFKG